MHSSQTNSKFVGRFAAFVTKCTVPFAVQCVQQPLPIMQTLGSVGLHGFTLDADLATLGDDEEEGLLVHVPLVIMF